MTQIIIQGPTYGSNQPVRLTVNGHEASFPCNTPVDLSEEQIDALRLTDHTFQILGDTVADEADEAPAPADSGGGGDAGGGEPSGESSPPIPPPTEEEAALPLNFLDRSVTAIIADLPTLNAAQLDHARADEDAGKTRKSLIAAIDQRIAALTPAPAA